MLTEKQITYILENKLIARQTKAHKKQVFDFAFGKKYMSSKDKGRKNVY
tara:strand:- start:7632 stop:7778 length:147 start_codon:yes stop_codon:yes gene_type:complete